MDVKVLESLKARVASSERERHAVIAEGHLAALAQCLVTDDEEHALVCPALEVLFYLSTEGALRSQLGAIDGLVANVKKFMARGRLKQKKLAVMTHKNLQAHHLLA